MSPDSMADGRSTRPRAESGQGPQAGSTEERIPSFPKRRRATKGTADPAVVRAVRFFEIVRRIAAQEGRPTDPPLTRARLADALRCDVRTIGRDLAELRRIGAVDYDSARRVYFLLDSPRRLAAPPPGNPLAPTAADPAEPRLTLPDAMALALARGALTAAGVPHRDAILAALDRACAGLPLQLAGPLARAGAVVQAGANRTLPRDYSGAPVAALVDAAAAQRSVRIDYDSASSGERTWRRVDPYAVAPRAGVFWELHGWCHRNRTIRTFALDRVYGVEVTEAAFTRREDAWKEFLAQQGAAVGGLLGSAGSRFAVDVRFAPEVARYARAYRWPASLTVSEAGDGTGAVVLSGAVGHVDAMVAELLRWRRHARVRGGPELCDAYGAELAAMLAAQTAGDDPHTRAPQPQQKNL